MSLEKLKRLIAERTQEPWCVRVKAESIHGLYDLHTTEGPLIQSSETNETNRKWMRAMSQVDAALVAVAEAAKIVDDNCIDYGDDTLELRDALKALDKDLERVT